VSLGPLTREQRLAGLLKFWFWVKTFYAYPDDITGDWRHALATWVPQVDSAKSDSAYYRVLRRMSVLLNDTHAQISHPLAGAQGLGQLFSPPLQVNWVEHRLLITRLDTSLVNVGITRGDEIVSINDLPISAVVSEERQYWSFSRDYGDELPPFTFMTGPRSSVVRLGVRTAAGVHQVTLPRSRPGRMLVLSASNSHPAYAVLAGNLGYIDLTRVTSLEQFDTAMKAMSGTEGLVLDRRGGAQSDFEAILPWFITEPAPWLRRMWSVSYVSFSGEFPTRAVGAQQAWTVFDWPPFAPVPRPRVYDKPVVLLTGENVSHSESLAAWFRLSKRATLVGAPTDGTQYSADSFVLPGGARWQITRVRIVWPDGSTFHRTGVVPDVLVKPTIAGVRAGRDEVYEAGLATLRRLVQR